MKLIHTKNYIDIAVGSALTLIGWIISPSLGFITTHLTGLILWYVRDPKRYFARCDRSYLSPVDGTISEIVPNSMCPYADGEWMKVVIKTSSFDSHIQYAPLEGNLLRHEIITELTQVHLSDLLGPKLASMMKLDFSIPIRFTSRTSIISQIHNPRSNGHCIVETVTDHYKFNLLPGLSKVSHNGFTDQVSRLGVGHFGLHWFHTNIYLDHNSEPQVELGQTVVGGETTIAAHPKPYYRLET